MKIFRFVGRVIVVAGIFFMYIAGNIQLMYETRKMSINKDFDGIKEY